MTQNSCQKRQTGRHYEQTVYCKTIKENPLKIIIYSKNGRHDNVKEDKSRRHLYVLTVRGLENSTMLIETSVVYPGAVSVGC